jgi:hypothetical protein
MFKKIFKFLGLANNTASMLNPEEYTNLILNCDLSDELYKKKFGQWLPTYLEQSENLTEKKYKLLFIHALLEDKHAYIYSMIPESSALMENIEKELIDSNETKLKITDLFPIDPFKGTNAYHPSKIIRYYKSSEDDESSFLKDFFNEDNDNPEKLVIARKVYNDFENLGLVGNALINDRIFNIELLLKMQNFKLNNTDIKKIQERTSLIGANVTKLFPPICTNEDVLNKIIFNEDNISNLKAIQDFYSIQSQLIHSSLYEDDFSFDDFNNTIKTKIDYLTLSKEMNHFENENQPTLIKSKKVKV